MALRRRGAVQEEMCVAAGRVLRFPLHGFYARRMGRGRQHKNVSNDE